MYFLLFGGSSDMAALWCKHYINMEQRQQLCKTMIERNYDILGFKATQEQLKKVLNGQFNEFEEGNCDSQICITAVQTTNCSEQFKDCMKHMMSNLRNGMGNDKFDFVVFEDLDLKETS